MDAAHAANVPLLVVQHTASAGAPIFDKGSHGWHLHPSVAARPHDLRMEKRFPSLFTGTPFADWIGAQRVDILSLAGYMTHNCIAATAFEAMHRGLAVEFLADAAGALPYVNEAGSATAEEVHRVTSVVLHTNFAAVTTTDAWTEAVRTGRAITRDSVYASNRRAREFAGNGARTAGTRRHAETRQFSYETFI